MGGNFDLGRVLSRGFQTIANQFAVFAALAILLAGVPSVLMRALAPTLVTAPSPDAPFAMFLAPWFWISMLVGIVLSALLQAALVRGSIQDLRSEPVELGPILMESLSLVVPMIVMSIVIFVGFIFGMILLLVPGIILYCMWIVAVPVLVEERRGIFGSLSRSAELTKGSRWWIFLLLVIYLVVGGVISGMTRFTASMNDTSNIPALIISLIVSSATGVVTAAMVASLYIELRAVKEGGAGGSLAEIFA
jgi:uncharacterized membrane protein